MERGGAGDAGDGGKWRGRSRARGDHQNPVTHSGPWGRSPLALPAHRCSQVAKGLCRRVLAPARANQSHPAPYWDGAGRRSAQPAVSFTGTQEKSGSVRIRGNVRDGSNRRIPQWLGEPDRFGTENRRLGPVLRGLSQGECGVEVRRLSNAAGWRVAWSAGYRSFLFDTGLNQRILADPLIALIQRKVSLHNAVWIAPIYHTSFWVVRGPRYLSAPHGQNPPTAHRIRHCLSRWHYHLQSGLAAAYGAPAGGSESAEGSVKCAIGRVEVRYLGFHLGHGQVRPQIDKTAAIAACPRPKTKKEVRQFLGLAGYYRRFIPDYSELTSPLTDLTKKEVPDTVPWTEQCQQAFTQVKAALCGGPLLHSPDFSLPFLLQTDASDRGLGAVLTQEIKGEERPVLYISRKLSKRETMYSTIEKECLAIRWAVLTLRYYLLGREFTLCSDHAPLQWLHRMKDTNARITRWYLALQPFKFKVIHRPGTQMIVADFLSRNGGGGGCRPEGFPAWVGRWGYVARGAWFSEVCSGRRTQETAVSKWVKCKMRNSCVWLQ